jgi:hypothetical protein
VHTYFYNGPVGRKFSSYTQDNLERKDAVVMFFYQNLNTGQLSLVMICGKKTEGASGKLGVKIQGLGDSDVQWEVRNGDPVSNRDDRDYFTTESGPIADTELASWTWSGGNNDGAGIGPIDPPFEAEVTLPSQFPHREGQQIDRKGVDEWLLFGGDNLEDPIELASVSSGDEPTATFESRGNIEEGTETITQPEPSPAVSDVADIEIETDVGGHPQVELRLDPVDENGETVTEVTGADFSVNEDEKPVGARVKRTSDAPRVVVYYDTSLSVILSGFYPKDDNRKLFRQRLRDDIQEASPGAAIEFNEAGSDSWGAMAEASSKDGNVIMYIADADGYSGSGTPAQRTAIKEGPPAIMMTTDGNRYDVADEMAELSGGRAIAGNSSEQVRDLLAQYLNDLDLKSYGLGYQSPNELSRERSGQSKLNAWW